jgi:hypothetical protein
MTNEEMNARSKILVDILPGILEKRYRNRGGINHERSASSIELEGMNMQLMLTNMLLMEIAERLGEKKK